MRQIVRLYVDCLLLGLAVGIAVLVGLVLSDLGNLRDAVLRSGDGMVGFTIVVFSAGLFSSIRFALWVIKIELAEDRAIAWRKRNGWGRSPRDRRRPDSEDC